MSFLGGGLDTIDLSTVDPNPAIDQSIDGTDGGASNAMDIANTVGQWGAVIGSIVTNHPITSVQTRSGAIVPTGVTGGRIIPSSSSSSLLVIVLALFGVGVIWAIATSKKAA